ncbi:MAG: hypothetical protein D6809_03070, partial [Gammaproteobacteria bacterium]
MPAGPAPTAEEGSGGEAGGTVPAGWAAYLGSLEVVSLRDFGDLRQLEPGPVAGALGILYAAGGVQQLHASEPRLGYVVFQAGGRLRKAALAGDQPVVSDLSSPPEAACPGGPGQRRSGLAPSRLALDWIELAVDRPGAGLVIYREAGPNERCGDGDDRYRYVRLDRSGAARDLPVPT